MPHTLTLALSPEGRGEISQAGRRRDYLMPHTLRAILTWLGITLSPICWANADPPDPPLEQTFKELVQPFVATYCSECHRGERPKGKLDLTRFNSLNQVAKGYVVWDRVAERLETEEMPPDDAKAQP